MNKLIFYEETEGLYIERIARDSEFKMTGKHFHTTYEIYYLLSGEIYYFIRDTIYRVPKGSLVFISANEIHKTSSASSSSHDRILLQISPDIVRSLTEAFPVFSAGELFESRVLPLDSSAQIQTERLLFSILEELRRRQTGYEEMLRLRLMEILLLSQRQKAQSSGFAGPVDSAKHRLVYRVAGYISENSRHNLPLDQLAARFYISKYYLCRIFKEVTGMTVTEYINENKIMLARQLLLNTDRNVTQVSEEAGYSSVTYFEKVFKAYLGMTPLAFRRMQQNG